MRLLPVTFPLSIALLLSDSSVLQGTNPVVSDPHGYDRDWLVVYDTLSKKCFGCHRSDSEERVDLSTYQALITGTMDDDPDSKIVVEGDPENSPIWEYVAWNSKADAHSDLADEPEMPPEQLEWLTTGQQEAIYRWIKNGAREFCDPRDLGVTELDYPSARTCASCHQRQFEEWSRSMHAYAQHSPVFEAFNLTLVERTGGTIGTFCSRCHTPIGTSLGENESLRNVNRTRISMEGVTCVVCHRRSTAHYKNNGRLPIEPGKLNDACMYGPFESSFSNDVGSHGSKDLPYIKTSQFCGECHDVVAPNGVRNEEAFSEWQQSPAANHGITCQMCHMGQIQGAPIRDCDRPLGTAAVVPDYEGKLPRRRITDHTFAGPDYSLLPDCEFPRKLDWMYEVDYRDEANLTPHQKVTLQRLRKLNQKSLEIADQKRLELLSNAARLHVVHPNRSACGETFNIEVEVENLVAGHNFPTGFTAERQLWVAVDVFNGKGQSVFRSGDLDHNGDLRNEHSHEVLTRKLPQDRYLLNMQNQFTAFTNRGTERTVVLPVNRHLSPINVLRPVNIPAISYGRPTTFRIAKGSLAPLKSLGQSYPVKSTQISGTYTIDVHLRFRHLPPTLFDHIGTPHLKRQLQIIDIAKYRGIVQVVP